MILSLPEEDETDLQNQLIVHIFGNSGLKEDPLIGIVAELSTKIKETVMNALEVVEKGIVSSPENSTV